MNSCTDCNLYEPDRGLYEPDRNLYEPDLDLYEPDTKEDRKLCEELELTWKYPKMGKVITLSPDCKGIFQSLQALKVILPAISEDILLAEAVFTHNSKLRKAIKLSPFQLVKEKQSEPPPVEDTVKLTHSSTNRLKHLRVQAQEKKSGDPQEVTNQYTSLVGYSAELSVKGNSQQVYNSNQPKPCKCGHQQPHNQSFPFISRKDERQNFLCKTGLCKPPPPPDRIGKGDHNFYKEIVLSKPPLPPPPKPDWGGGSQFLQGKKGGTLIK